MGTIWLQPPIAPSLYITYIYTIWLHQPKTPSLYITYIYTISLKYFTVGAPGGAVC
jgi:hypothetical protein